MRLRHITIALTWIILLIAHKGSAQLRLDIIGGISPRTTPQNAGLIVNRHLPSEEFVFNMIEVEPQLFGGIKGLLPLGAPFFTDAALMYTKSTSTYHALYTIIDAEHPQPDYFMNESKHLLLVPINIGVNIGGFDITSGFRVMKTISEKSELSDMNGFSIDGASTQFGWQGSVGFSFMRTRVGIEYQGSFSRVGSGMEMNGQSLELMNVPGQLLLTVQYNVL